MGSQSRYHRGTLEFTFIGTAQCTYEETSTASHRAWYVKDDALDYDVTTGYQKKRPDSFVLSAARQRYMEAILLDAKAFSMTEEQHRHHRLWFFIGNAPMLCR